MPCNWWPFTLAVLTTTLPDEGGLATGWSAADPTCSRAVRSDKHLFACPCLARLDRAFHRLNRALGPHRAHPAHQAAKMNARNIRFINYSIGQTRRRRFPNLGVAEPKRLANSLKLLIRRRSVPSLPHSL